MKNQEGIVESDNLPQSWNQSLSQETWNQRQSQETWNQRHSQELRCQRSWEMLIAKSCRNIEVKEIGKTVRLGRFREIRPVCENVRILFDDSGRLAWVVPLTKRGIWKKCTPNTP